MKQIKNKHSKPGVMFIEVVIALAIMGIASVALLGLQSTTLNLVWRRDAVLTRIFQIKNLFFSPESQQIFASKYKEERVFKKVEKLSNTNLECSVMPVPKKSELSKFENLYLAKSQGSWYGHRGKKVEDLVSFIYISPPDDGERQ